jgi:hypothetical protein
VCAMTQTVGVQHCNKGRVMDPAGDCCQARSVAQTVSR